jgi:hypothetical protein
MATMTFIVLVAASENPALGSHFLPGIPLRAHQLAGSTSLSAKNRTAV